MATLPEMIDFLNENGMSLSRIAELCETSQPTISRIKRGQEPMYKVGKRIESLYQECFTDKSTAAA